MESVGELGFGYSISTPQEDLYEVFQMFDEDGNGTIEISEFLYQLTRLEMQQPNGREFDKWWSGIDIDGNGVMSFEEFCAPQFEALTEKKEAAHRYLEGLYQRGYITEEVYKKKKALIMLGYDLSPEADALAHLFERGEEEMNCRRVLSCQEGKQDIGRLQWALKLRSDGSYKWCA